MKWFDTVFLPSLEERYRQRGKLWLTAKQASVCKNYMKPSSSVRGCYTYKMGEKKSYSIQVAPNGCAAFHVYVDGREGRSEGE